MRMIQCIDCQTENTLDSTYCRACGGRLPEDAILRLKAENHNLVQDAKLLFSDHRFAECKMMLESVLTVEPGNIDALALLGDVHEREGHLHDAIELYERVVADRPDSAIDRVRLSHLRKLVQTEDLAVAAPTNRRNAVLAGVAGTILLVSVGAALILATNPTTTEAKVGSPNAVASNTDANGAVGFTNSIVPVPQYQNNDPASTGPTSDSGQNTNAQLNTTQTNPDVNPNPRGYVGSSRNLRGGTMGSGAGTIQDPGLQPLVFQANPTPTNPGAGNSTNTATTTPNIPDPKTTIDPNGNSNGNDDGNKAKPEDPGIIQITVNQNKTNDSTDNGRSVDALVAKARNLYLTGNYGEALKAYEEALRKGAKPGSTNQRIAQCYEKTGNKAGAIAAYKRAVTAYEASISAGSGNEAVQAALDSCKQAIKNLGG